MTTSIPATAAPTVVAVSVQRLADLERIEAAARTWLRVWTQAATPKGDTASAFKSSQALAAAVKAAGPTGNVVTANQVSRV